MAASSGSTPPRTILVVDNGCTPCVQITDELRTTASFEILRSEVNTGSAGGYHLGLARLLETPDWTHVWMLDDDNLPDPLCLENLLKFQLGLPEGSIAVSHRPDRREFLALAQGGGQPPPARNSFQEFTFSGLLRRVLPHRDQTPGQGEIPLYAFGYGGALIPRAALQDGKCLPDPRLFLYHDDSEWAWRLWNHGHRAFLCTTAIIKDIDTPWGGFRRNGASPLFSTQTHRSKLWFSLRNRAWLERQMGFSGLRHDGNAMLWIALMVARTLVAERSFKDAFGGFQVAWRAYREGSKGRLTPFPPAANS